MSLANASWQDMQTLINSSQKYVFSHKIFFSRKAANYK